MNQADLFGSPLPPRPPVRVWREWLPDDDRVLRVLAGALQWEQRHLERDGRRIPMPRLELFAATRPATYRYSGVSYRAKRLEQHPELLRLLEQVSAFLQREGVLQAPFDAVFANMYRNGSESIGWHRDDERVLGPEAEVQIASLSLGTPRKFSMRKRGLPEVRYDWQLGHGDLLFMDRGSQSAWEHAAPKTQRPVGPRIALTFRALRAV